MSGTKSLTLEVGKVYEDNVGAKWRCLATDIRNPWPVLLLRVQDSYSLQHALVTGEMAWGGRLVREVKPPVVGYVNLWKHPDGSLQIGQFTHPSSEAAIKAAKENIASVAWAEYVVVGRSKIELIEGRFDD